MNVSWTTNPFDPLVADDHRRLIDHLTTLNIVQSDTTQLGNGVSRFHFTLSGSQPLSEINSVVAKITYPPITVSVTPRSVILDNPTDLFEIIKSLASRKLQVNVDNIEITQYEDRLTLSLYDPIGNEIYGSTITSRKFLSIPFNELVGYRLVSDDPLVYLSLNELVTGYYPPGSRLTQLEGMLLLKRDPSSSSMDDEYVSRVRDAIDNHHYRRHFTFPQTLTDVYPADDYSHVVDLAKLYGLEIVSTNGTLNGMTVITLSGNPPGDSPDVTLDYTWLIDSLDKVKTGRLPTYTLRVDNPQLEGYLFYRAKLYALGLSTLNKVLPEWAKVGLVSNGDSQLRVGCDSSVTFPVTDRTMLTSFISLYLQSLPQITQWYTKLLGSRREGVTYLYYLSISQPGVKGYVVPLRAPQLVPRSAPQQASEGSLILVVMTDDQGSVTFPSYVSGMTEQALDYEKSLISPSAQRKLLDYQVVGSVRDVDLTVTTVTNATNGRAEVLNLLIQPDVELTDESLNDWGKNLFHQEMTLREVGFKLTQMTVVV